MQLTAYCIVKRCCASLHSVSWRASIPSLSSIVVPFASLTQQQISREHLWNVHLYITRMTSIVQQEIGVAQGRRRRAGSLYAARPSPPALWRGSLSFPHIIRRLPLLRRFSGDCLLTQKLIACLLFRQDISCFIGQCL